MNLFKRKLPLEIMPLIFSERIKNPHLNIHHPDAFQVRKKKTRKWITAKVLIRNSLAVK